MRHPWAWLTLFLTIPAQAGSLPEGAEQRLLSPDDQRRLIQLIVEHSKADSDRQQSQYKEEREVSRSLMAELYGPSPNLRSIETLDRRLRRLQQQSRQHRDNLLDEVYRGLSPEDRLKFMKMNHALPPIVTTVPNSQNQQRRVPGAPSN